MKSRIIFLVALALALGISSMVFAAEHGGKEHGGTKVLEPSAKDIHAAMRGYISQQAKKSGTFDITDEMTGKTRKLTLVNIHQRVGKTGNYYYSCADFRDSESGEMLDLDLDVDNKNGKLAIVAVRIHKVNGKERYTYDSSDNRIPIKAAY